MLVAPGVVVPNRGHFLHDLVPKFGWYLPFGHSSHSSPSTLSLYWPGLHGTAATHSSRSFHSQLIPLMWGDPHTVLSTRLGRQKVALTEFEQPGHSIVYIRWFTRFIVLDAPDRDTRCPKTVRLALSTVRNDAYPVLAGARTYSRRL